jgi:hypothetical protein
VANESPAQSAVADKVSELLHRWITRWRKV